MLRTILLKTLWEQRRSLAWWSAGMAAAVLLIVLVYPSVRDVPEFRQLIDGLPEVVRNLFLGAGVLDFLSPTGYLHSRFFAFLAPAVFLVYAIGQGVGGVSGEEERGTIEALLSAPVARWRLVVEKFGALVCGMAILAAATFAAVWAGGTAVTMDIAVVRIFHAVLSLALLGIMFGALALAAGAVTGNKGLSVGLPAGFAVAAYLVDALAPLVDALDALRVLSPFRYYGEAVPLANGIDFAHAAVLALAALVLAAAAALGLERRDLRV
ncbi:MAG: ABC transporter permease subunit [Dehalococcoidia bacterium]|nr:ABC transporter permease subunit [Dehalococcoidia bacterium]